MVSAQAVHGPTNNPPVFVGLYRLCTLLLAFAPVHHLRDDDHVASYHPLSLLVLEGCTRSERWFVVLAFTNGF